MPTAAEPTRICVLDVDDLSRSPQTGTMHTFEWQRLARWCASPAVVADKASEGGFVLADLRNGIRRNSHVVSVSALAIDHDAGTIRLSGAHTALVAYTHIAYTTASHTVEAPRWRAIVAVSRPITVDEYRVLWAHVARHIEHAGVALDHARDACRLWYSPTIRTINSPFEWCACDGRPLDVDRLLVMAAAQIEKERRPRAPKPAPGRRDRYITVALEKAAAAVSSASHGDRHATLLKEAFGLARLDLDERQIASALLPAFVTAAGGHRQLEGRRAIRDAVRARKGDAA